MRVKMILRLSLFIFKVVTSFLFYLLGPVSLKNKCCEIFGLAGRLCV